MFDQKAEQIFSSVFGRPPASSNERSFLASAAQRKQGAQLQGALEFKQQQGGFGGQPSSGTSNVDPISQAMESVQAAAKNVAQERQKLSTEKMRTDLTKQLLANKGIQALIKMEGQLGKGVQEAPTGIEGSETISPTTQGNLQLSNLGDIIQNLSSVSRGIDTRREGVLTTIESQRQGEQEQFERAQAEQASSQGLLTSMIQGQGAQQQAELFPIQKRAAELGLQTEILTQDKIRSEIASNYAKARDENPQVVPQDPNSLSNNSQAVLRNPALFKEFTPGERGKIISELQAYGADDTQLSELTYASLSDAARKELAQFDGVISIGNQALEALNKGTFGTGPVQTRKNQALSKLGVPPEGWVDYAALSSISSAQELRRQSGVAVTPEEFKRLEPFLPEIGDQESVAKQKLANFTRIAGELQSDRAKRALQTSVDLGREFQGGLPEVGGTFKGEKVINVKEIK